MEYISTIAIVLVILAFILEFFDSYAGMGFGTMVPVLFLLGYEPLVVIPAVLFCGGILSVLAGILHHRAHNVNLFEKKTMKVTSIFLASGLAGITVGAFIAVNLPPIFLEIYIGIVILVIGILIMLNLKIKNHFSWKKIIGVGILASFNKGLTGGGFGSVVSGGGILSGLDAKSAVGIAMISEGILSFIGVAIYGALEGFDNFNWTLVISLLLGGFLAVPLAVHAMKLNPSKKIRLMTGIVSIVIGISVFLKLLI